MNFPVLEAIPTNNCLILAESKTNTCLAYTSFWELSLHSYISKLLAFPLGEAQNSSFEALSYSPKNKSGHMLESNTFKESRD